MSNYLSKISFSLIIIFSLLFAGCDQIKKEKQNVSLKGEKVVSQTSKNIYSINAKSKKAIELQNQITTYLQEINSKEEGNSKISNRSNQNPIIKEAIIVDNNEIGKEYILVPINTGAKEIKKVSIIEYNSKTNSISNETMFKTTKTDSKESTITDRSGETIYSSDINHKGDTGDVQTSDFNFGACYNHMTEKLEEERIAGQEAVCDFLGCGWIEGTEAVVRCADYAL